jgi:hypothetical protein
MKCDICGKEFDPAIEWVNADKSFMVEAEDFILGENLIIE